MQIPSSRESNPYVGPVPFTDKEKDLFFGREKEAKRLLSLAISERVVLFYAPSGAGKSSLINAGLIPGLENHEYKIFPTVRVGGTLPSGRNLASVNNIYVFNTLLSLAGKIDTYEILVDKPLSSFVTEEMQDPKAVPHWLIFDQFEEILTTHPELFHKRRDFFRQLAAALDVD